jgi:murein peptide amidase A
MRMTRMLVAVAAITVCLWGVGANTGRDQRSASATAPDGPSSESLRTKLARLDRTAMPGVPSRQTTITAGRSALGRRIRVKAYGYPNPRQFDGTSNPNRWYRKVLVFGCVHGTECAASGIHGFTMGGCPPAGRIFFVPNLNPDGLALGTRLNGRGVDLNRNFPAGWRAIGRRWDLQYSGPHPLSEPETRLASRMIEAIHPDLTIWFHQEAEPMVRAWGPSVSEARRYARLSGLPFRHLPWLAGTAPNWQNHRFDGTSSFVVELPFGPLSGPAASRQETAVSRLSG